MDLFLFDALVSGNLIGTIWAQDETQAKKLVTARHNLSTLAVENLTVSRTQAASNDSGSGHKRIGINATERAVIAASLEAGIKLYYQWPDSGDTHLITRIEENFLPYDDLPAPALRLSGGRFVRLKDVSPLDIVLTKRLFD